MKKQIKKKQISILGFPMDLGADLRGVDMGPSAIRIAGLRRGLEKLGYKVEDHGNLLIEIKERQRLQDAKLKYLDAICRTSEDFAQGVEGLLEGGHFPLLLGGDHSMALGSIAGIASWCRKQKLRLGVLWVDAHTDMNTHQTTPSGNIHGMPLSASLGLGHEKLTGLYGFSPKIEAGDCALLGIRSIDATEKDNIRQMKLPLYTMADIDRHGMYHCISEIINGFKGRIDHLHLSFDLDALDPVIAPGVGTPVPGGINYREAHLVMEAIAESGMLSSIEVTEVNPMLDSHNKSAELAVELIVSAMGKKIF